MGLSFVESVNRSEAVFLTFVAPVQLEMCCWHQIRNKHSVYLQNSMKLVILSLDLACKISTINYIQDPSC